MVYIKTSKRHIVGREVFLPFWEEGKSERRKNITEILKSTLSTKEMKDMSKKR